MVPARGSHADDYVPDAGHSPMSAASCIRTPDQRVPEVVPRAAFCDTRAMTITHWPSLHFNAWKDTCETLHLWTQIVGKIRLAQTPWQITRGTCRSTSRRAAHYLGDSVRAGPPSQIDFDFVDHALVVRDRATGRGESLPLQAESVAAFLLRPAPVLDELDRTCHLAVPVEIAKAIPFAEDDVHAAYDPEYVRRFWHVCCSRRPMLCGDFKLRSSARPVPFTFSGAASIWR